MLRMGWPGEKGRFNPPLIVNPDPSLAARDLAIVSTGAGRLLAALDRLNSSISFYSPTTFARTVGPVVPDVLPVRIVAGDLNGEGRDDLIVAAAGSNKLFVYMH